jgi:hypothetical protein
MMDPDEDYISIAATEQQTATTKANRKKELEEAHANLKGSFATGFSCFSALPATSISLSLLMSARQPFLASSTQLAHPPPDPQQSPQPPSTPPP